MTNLFQRKRSINMLVDKNKQVLKFKSLNYSNFKFYYLIKLFYKKVYNYNKFKNILNYLKFFKKS